MALYNCGLYSYGLYSHGRLLHRLAARVLLALGGAQPRLELRDLGRQLLRRRVVAHLVTVLSSWGTVC